MGLDLIKSVDILHDIYKPPNKATAIQSDNSLNFNNS